MLEGDDFDTQFLSVLLDCVLCVVGAVEVFSGAVFAGPGVVTANDEVRGAVVFADNGVPDCFSGAAHTHGKGKETEYCHSIGVAGEESLIDTYAGEVVDVAGFCEADYGVDEDVCLTSSCCTDG